MIHKICVDIFVFFFPVITDSLCLIFVFHRQGKIYNGVSLGFYLASNGIIMIRSAVIICEDCIFLAKYHFVFFKIFVDVCLDCIGNLVFKKAKCFTTGSSNRILGVGVCGFCKNQIGINKVSDDLLDAEVIGIFQFKEEFLRVLKALLFQKVTALCLFHKSAKMTM